MEIDEAIDANGPAVQAPPARAFDKLQGRSYSQLTSNAMTHQEGDAVSLESSPIPLIACAPGRAVVDAAHLPGRTR